MSEREETNMENLDSLVEQGIMGGDKPVNEQNETKPNHQDHSQNMLKPLEKTKDKPSDNVSVKY
jgi:hypothetical protein